MLTANKLGALGVLIADGTRAAVADLSPTAAALLLTLHYHGAMTASALAGIAGITQPTSVRVTSGLITRGLVTRVARVGRTAPVELTVAGQRRARSAQQARLTMLAGLLATLSDAERATLEPLLDTMLAGATASRGMARTTCRLCDHGLCDGPACPIGTRASEIKPADSNPKG